MTGRPRVAPITLEHEAECMTCEGWVRFGEPVYYCPGVGIWHKACERPKNLQTHWDEAQKRKALEL